MKTKIKKWFGNFYNVYLLILTSLVALPILAPVMLKLGLELPAKIIYFVYSFFCHQFATRSIHVFDYQFAWCARDTGIWAGVALVAWLFKYKKVRAIKWYWVIPFVIPIALDGGIQTIFTLLNLNAFGGLSGMPLYASNNLIRFITGSFFGIGLSLWVSGTFLDEVIPEPQITNAKDKFKNLIIKSQAKVVALSMAGLLMCYLFAVALWNLTSSKVLPTDFADSAVKLQETNFFERRADGICPSTDIKDLFDFNCFF